MGVQQKRTERVYEAMGKKIGKPKKKKKRRGPKSELEDFEPWDQRQGEGMARVEKTRAERRRGKKGGNK